MLKKAELLKLKGQTQLRRVSKLIHPQEQQLDKQILSFSSEEEDNQNENELIGKKDFHLYLKTLMKQLERKQSKVDRAIIKLA